MPYVIRRTDQKGGYVALPGSDKSYTHDLLKAQKFPSREQAEANRCVKNEVVEDLNQILGL